MRSAKRNDCIKRWRRPVGLCLLGALLFSRATGEEVSIQVDASNRPALRWTVEGSRFFRLEFADTFPATNWTFVPVSGLNLLATTNDILAQDIQLPIAARFYRLRSVGVLSSNVVQMVVDAAGSGDHTTITAAVASMPPEGGMVTVRAGMYAGGLTIPSRVTLRGAGADQTRILAPVWSGTGPRTEAVTVMGDDVVIEGLEVDGQQASQPATADTYGLITVVGSRVSIRDCRLANASSHGVSLFPTASDAIIENCEIYGNSTNNFPAGTPGTQQVGLRCQGPRPILRNNLVRGWGQAVVLAGGVINGRVEGNQLTYFGQGIVLTGSCAGILVQSNSFPLVLSNAVAIKAAGGDAHQIVGNLITATNYAVAIWLAAGTNHLVSGNSTTLPGQHVLVYSSDNRIEGNRLEDTGVPVTGIVRIETPGALRNVSSNNIIIGYSQSTVAFNFVNGAAANSAVSNLLLRVTPAFDISGAVGNTVTLPVQPVSQVFVGPLDLNGAVLGQPRGVRLVAGTLTIASISMVDAMSLLPSGGGIVIVDEGVYDGSYVLPGNTVIRGQGIGRTVLRAPVDGRGQILIVNGSNVLIEAVTLDGRRSAYTVLPDEAAGFGIISVNAANVTVTNCVVRDSLKNGISVGVGVPGFRVENCVVENSATNNVPQGTPGGHGYGIFCAGSTSPVIRSNVVRGWAQAVGLWPGVTNGLVEFNQIVDNFGFLDTAHTINRSACEDYGAGVVPHGWNIWRSNLVDGSTASCLEIAQGVTSSHFIGNTLRRPGQISNYGEHWAVTGVIGQTNRGVLIAGNTIISDGTRDDACAVNGVAYNTVISNNTFTGFTYGTFGPLILGGNAGSRDSIVVSNTFTSCRYGVRVNGDATGFIVRGNTFTDVQQSDAAIWADSTGSGRIEGNTITGSQPMVGIRLTDSQNGGQAGNIVTGNRITVPGSGIFCLTSNNVITNNVFNETIADGVGTVLLAGVNAVGNLVASNSVSTLSSWAIRLANGADRNTITNNLVAPFAIRIEESAGTNNVILGN